jgi:DNA-binding PadR family transcriptional regulator
MYINLTDDDQISLTLKEISILTALAHRPASGYNIAKSTPPMSNGTLRPALRRLELGALIHPIEATDTRPDTTRKRIVYQLTPTGKIVLKWHIHSLRRLADLAEARLSQS